MLQRLLDVSAQLQQSQADLLGSQRRTAELQTEIDESSAKVEGLEKIRTQLTQASPTKAELTCSIKYHMLLNSMFVWLAKG